MVGICTLTSSFDSWGSCLVNNVFFGDWTLASIIVLIMFGYLLVKFQAPLELIFPVGLGLTFTLYLLTGSIVMLGLFALLLVLSGVFLAIALLDKIGRL